MMGTILVVLAIVGQAPARASAASPEDLVARLGSPRFAEREAAAAELQKLGRGALAALSAGRGHRDLEIRTRVAALVAKIEGSLLLEPTPITLDFVDRPIAEVVASVARQGDLSLTLAQGMGADRRVTLRAEGPVPFWTAIDRLVEAGHLGCAPASPGRGLGRDRAFVLMPDASPPAGMVSDHGPFRVALTSLHYQRDLSFDGQAAGMPQPPGGPGLAGQEAQATRDSDGRMIVERFHATLQAAAEPRLALRQAGPLKLSSALDDLGQSLIAPPPNPNGMATVYYGPNGGTDSVSIQLTVPLKRPASPGRSIRLLRGSIPVQVATRRPSPLVVPLEDAAGKTFRNEDASLVVHELKPMNPAAGANSPYSLDLAITARPSRLAGATNPPPDFDPFAPRVDLGTLQLELADASGHSSSWYVSSTQPDGEQQRVTLVVNPSRASGPPATLRYFGTVRATTEIPFEFRDVPMP